MYFYFVSFSLFTDHLRHFVPILSSNMQTVPSGRQPARGGVQTQDDGGGADIPQETKRAGQVRGLQEGGGGRVAGSSSDDSAWEGKGGQVELDRRSHGRRRGTSHL